MDEWYRLGSDSAKDVPLVLNSFLEANYFLLEWTPFWEGFFFTREANRKSQKLFPFVKMVEKHRDVPIHL